MIVCSALVFGALVWMNRLHQDLDKQALSSATQIAMVKQEKPKPKKIVEKPKPKPKRSQPRSPLPVSGLDSVLSGIDFGLPGPDIGSLDAMDSTILGDTKAVVMTADSVDVPPRPKSQSKFVYPRSAKKQGVTGYVVVSLLIDISGQVEKAQVLEASPVGVFEESALEGIRHWRFEPARYQGNTVKVWAQQKIRFDLG